MANPLEQFLQNFEEGVSDNKKRNVTEASQNKKDSLSGSKPAGDVLSMNPYRMAAGLTNPELEGGLSPEETMFSTFGPVAYESAYGSPVPSDTLSQMGSYVGDAHRRTSWGEDLANAPADFIQGAANVGLGAATSAGAGIDALTGNATSIAPWTVGASEAFNAALDSYKGEAYQARDRAFQARMGLVDEIGKKAYEEDLAKYGENSAIPVLSSLGRDARNAAMQAISDPHMRRQLFTQGLGSMAALAATGGVGAGAAVSAGAIGGGAYEDAYNRAMSQLAFEPEMTMAEKRTKAQEAANIAAGVGTAVGLPLGLADAALARSLLGKKAAGDVSKKVTEKIVGKSGYIGHVGKETAQEFAEGATEGFAGNVGIQQKIDPNQRLSEGVGSRAGLEAVGGGLSAAGIGAPKYAAKAIVGTMEEIDKRREVKKIEKANKAAENLQTNVEEIKTTLDSAEDLTPEQIAGTKEILDNVGSSSLVHQMKDTSEEGKKKFTKTLDVLKNIKNVDNYLDDPEMTQAVIDAHQIINEAVSRKQQADELNLSDEQRSKYLADVDSLFGAMGDLYSDPEIEQRVEALSTKVQGDVADSTKEVSQPKAEIAAATIIADPVNANPQAVERLIRGAVPAMDASSDVNSDVKQEGKENPYNLDKNTFEALKLVQGALQVLSETAGKDTASKEQARSEKNVADTSERRGKFEFISLKDHLNKIVTAKKSGDVKATEAAATRLAKFAQSQANKLAAMNFSREEAERTGQRAPEISAATYDAVRDAYYSSAGKAVFSIPGSRGNSAAVQNSVKQHAKLEQEVEAATKLFDFVNSFLGSKLPAIDMAGASWAVKGTSPLIIGKDAQGKLVQSVQGSEGFTVVQDPRPQQIPPTTPAPVEPEKQKAGLPIGNRLQNLTDEELNNQLNLLEDSGNTDSDEYSQLINEMTRREDIAVAENAAEESNSPDSRTRQQTAKDVVNSFLGSERADGDIFKLEDVTRNKDEKLFRDSLKELIGRQLAAKEIDQDQHKTFKSIIENGKFVSDESGTYLETDSKPILDFHVNRALNSNAPESLKAIWKVMQDILPSGSKTRIGFAKSSGYDPAGHTILAPMGKNGMFTDQETAFHEYFHAVTVGTTDKNFNESMKVIKTNLQNLYKSKKDSLPARVKQILEYALDAEKSDTVQQDEVSAVLASSLELVEYLSNPKTKPEVDLKGLPVIKRILSKVFAAIAKLFASKSQIATEAQLKEYLTLDRVFSEVFQEYGTKTKGEKVSRAKAKYPVVDEGKNLMGLDGVPLAEGGTLMSRGEASAYKKQLGTGFRVVKVPGTDKYAVRETTAREREASNQSIKRNLRKHAGAKKGWPNNIAQALTENGGIDPDLMGLFNFGKNPPLGNTYLFKSKSDIKNSSSSMDTDSLVDNDIVREYLGADGSFDISDVVTAIENAVEGNITARGVYKPSDTETVAKLFQEESSDGTKTLEELEQEQQSLEAELTKLGVSPDEITDAISTATRDLDSSSSVEDYLSLGNDALQALLIQKQNIPSSTPESADAVGKTYMERTKEILSSLGSGIGGVGEAVSSWVKQKAIPDTPLARAVFDSSNDFIEGLQKAFEEITLSNSELPIINLITVKGGDGKDIRGQFERVAVEIRERLQYYEPSKAWVDKVPALVNSKSPAVLYPQEFTALWATGDKGYSDEVVKAITYASLLWFHSGGMASARFTGSSLAKRFSKTASFPFDLDKNDDETKSLTKFFGDFSDGNAMSSDIAKMAAEILGISIKGDVPLAAEGLITSLGLLGANALLDAGLIERYHIDKTNLRAKKNFEPVPRSDVLGKGGENTIVAFKPVSAESAGKAFTYALNQYILENEDEENGRSRVYTNQDTKPIPVPKSLKRSSTLVDPDAAKAIKAANSIDYRMVNSVRAVYEVLGAHGLDVLFGSGYGDNLQEMVEAGQINESHAISLLGQQKTIYGDYDSVQAYSNIFDEAESNDVEDFAVRFAHSTGQNHRIYQDSAIGTPQASKLLRALLSPNKATFKIGQGQADEVFHRAVAQSLGVKVGEDPNWRNKLNDLLKSGDIADALEALKAAEKGDNIPENLLDILNKVANKNVGEGPVTLQALIEYARYQEAYQDAYQDGNTDVEFTTYLPIEADGKTNGPAGVIAMLVTQFNADWFTDMQRVGVDIGAAAPISFAELLNKGSEPLKDMYVKVAGISTNALKLAKDVVGLKLSGNLIKDALLLATSKWQSEGKDRAMSPASANRWASLIHENQYGMSIQRLQGTTEAQNIHRAVNVIGVLNNAASYASIELLNSLGSKMIEADVNNTDGSIVFTVGRNLVKNPITVTLYGSGTRGIASKLTKAVFDALYLEATELLQKPGVLDSEFSEFLAKISKFSEEAASITHGYKLSSSGENIIYNSTAHSKGLKANSKFQDILREASKDPKQAVQKLDLTPIFSLVQEAVNGGYVKHNLHPSIESGVGNSAMEATKEIIQLSGILSAYAKAIFDDSVNTLFEKRKTELLQIHPELEGRRKFLRASHFLSKTDFDTLAEEASAVNPAVELEHGSLDISDSERIEGADDVRNISAGIDQVRAVLHAGIPSRGLARVGVEMAPGLTISSGDAAAIIRSFLKELQKVLPVFDGINLAVDNAVEMNQKINEANMDGWSQNLYQKFVDLIEKAVDSLPTARTRVAMLEKAFPKTYDKDGKPKHPLHMLLKSAMEASGKSAGAISNIGKLNYSETDEILNGHLETLLSSFKNYAEITRAKVQVLEMLGYSSDQFSAVEGASFKEGDAKKLKKYGLLPGDFANLSTPVKKNLFEQLLRDQIAENQKTDHDVQMENKTLNEFLDDVAKDPHIAKDDKTAAKYLKQLAKVVEEDDASISEVKAVLVEPKEAGSTSKTLREVFKRTADLAISKRIFNWLMGNVAQDADGTREGKLQKLAKDRLRNILEEIDTAVANSIHRTNERLLKGFASLKAKLASAIAEPDTYSSGSSFAELSQVIHSKLADSNLDAAYKESLASALSSVYVSLISSTYSDPNLRNVFGKLRTTDELKTSVKGILSEVKEELDNTSKDKPSVLKKLRNLIRGVLNQILGNYGAGKYVSYAEDLRAVATIISYAHNPKPKKQTPPSTPPNDTTKTKKDSRDSQVRGMVPATKPDQTFNPGSVRNMLNEIPSLQTAEAVEVIEASVSQKISEEQLIPLLRDIGFILTSDQEAELVSLVLKYNVDAEVNPSSAYMLTEVMTEFLNKNETSSSENVVLTKAILTSKALKNLGKRIGFDARPAVFASLVQTYSDVASAVDAAVDMNTRTKEKSLSAFLDNMGQALKDKLMGMSIGNKVHKLRASEAVKAFVDNLRLREINENVLDTLNTSKEGLLNKLDDITSDALQYAASKLKESEHAAVKVAGSLIDKNDRQAVADALTAFGNLKWQPDLVRAAIRDLVAHDSYMDALTTLNKRAKNIFQSMRQGVREQLPITISNLFGNSLNKDQWTALTNTVGKLDFGVFSGSDALNYIRSNSDRDVRIKELEDDLDNNVPNWNQIKTDAKKLAEYLNTGSATQGIKLNAYAILFFGSKEQLSEENVTKLDELISLYAIQDMDPKNLKELRNLAKRHPEGLQQLVDYVKGVRAQEGTIYPTDGDKESGASIYLNQRKGFIPQSLELGSGIRLATRKEGSTLLQRGYKEVASHGGIAGQKLYYYYAPVTGLNAFIQGVSQNIRPTSFGIDKQSGLPRGGINAGLVTNPKMVKALIQNDDKTLFEGKEGLLPIYGVDGTVVAFERMVDLSKVTEAKFDDNFAKLLGIQVGRQYEELGAKEINNHLVERTFKQWESADQQSRRSEYVNVLDPTQLTKVQRDAISLVPRELKNKAKEMFDGKWMIRRDQIDVAFGYRQPGVGDFLTGITNWSPETQENVLKIMNSMFGKKGMAYVLKGEEYWRSVIKESKTLIVVKSVTVSAANSFYNIIQLLNNGVSLADIARTLPRVLNESIILTESLNKEIGLRNQIIGASSDTQKVESLLAQIDMLHQARKKLSIYPLYERGEFGSVQDVGDAADLRALASGDIFSKMQEKLDNLPKGIQDVVKNGYLTKDSGAFQFLQKSVEYGDFVAKAILYENEMKKLDKKDPAFKQKHEDLFRLIKHEFVDYDLPSGRNRTWADGMGILWFWNYKLRTTKAALRLAFDHPFRTLMYSVTPFDTPAKENIFSKWLEGTLPASMGIGFLFRSPSLHPINHLIP